MREYSRLNPLALILALLFEKWNIKAQEK